MELVVVSVTLFVALLFPVTQVSAVTSGNDGAGTLYRLSVTQDVTLESPNRNYNYLQFLLVAKHPQYPNKRSLVQFEDLPNSCPSSKIKWAKMYLYYVYSHKASSHSVQQTPFITRFLEVHLVKKHWKESQATSSRRINGASWSKPWLGLDGTDAEASSQCGTVPIYTSRPRGFVEFDVTAAVKSWKNGVANNGLVIRATNELQKGRDIRFASNAERDSSKHAVVHVLCAY